MKQLTRVMELCVRFLPIDYYIRVVNVSTNEYSLLNYKAVAATSYKILDEEIGKLYPNLKRNSKQDLRTYAKFLQTKFPKLTNSICNNYVRFLLLNNYQVATYESAKFSDCEWNAEMFEEWKTFFRNFTEALALPSELYSSLIFTTSFVGNQVMDPKPEYDESDEEDMGFVMQHDLEDSDVN